MNTLTYPCKTMNITQSYTGSYSHAPNVSGSPKDYPIDEAGTDSGRDWFFCPCDEMQVVRITGVGNSYTNAIWMTSTSPVVMPCTTDSITIMLIHPEDDDLSKIKVGQKFKRGDKVCREGKDGNATGNHFHMSFGCGKIEGNGWKQNSKGAYVLTTTGISIKPEEACYLDSNFTTVKNANGIKFEALKGEVGMKGLLYIGDFSGKVEAQMIAAFAQRGGHSCEVVPFGNKWGVLVTELAKGVTVGALKTALTTFAGVYSCDPASKNTN